jgi:hypothetical protein
MKEGFKMGLVIKITNREEVPKVWSAERLERRTSGSANNQHERSKFE